MITKEIYEEQKALSDRWKEMYYEKKNEIDQLTNNWNELEEWLKDTPMTIDRRFTVVRTDDVLDKMKEIKGGNK